MGIVMYLGLRRIVAGAALFGSVSAVALGIATLRDGPTALSLSYLGGGAIVFRVALRNLLPAKGVSP